MKREITAPTYYQGDTVIDMAGNTVPWDFTTDKDIQFTTTNDLNASAQLEADFTFLLLEPLVAENATNVWQEFTDPGEDNVVWHYDMGYSGKIGNAVGVVVIPYVSELLPTNGSTDSQSWQQLEAEYSSDGTLNYMRSKGSVIRRKLGVGGGDALNLAFGILFWNTSAGTLTVEGMGHVSVHPNTLPMIIADPGI